MPDKEKWEDYIPKFREDDEDNPRQHLKDFHSCMHLLGIYEEDVLMKLFMLSLERDARQWIGGYLLPTFLHWKIFIQSSILTIGESI